MDTIEIIEGQAGDGIGYIVCSHIAIRDWLSAEVMELDRNRGIICLIGNNKSYLSYFPLVGQGV